MRVSNFLFIAFFSIVFFACKEKSKHESSVEIVSSKNFFQGKWVRMSPNGPISIYFTADGKVKTDIGDNRSTDVISQYRVTNDTIEFFDEKGKACPESGLYKIYDRGYSISFDVLNDECNGRIKSTMGFWVRPNHQKLLSELNLKIRNSDSIEHVLHRGRIYLALGKSKLAKQDFDLYLAKDSLNSKVFIHRAATRFPNDFEGVFLDCNRSIAIDSTDKNAFFLRGIALYELGKKQQACNDFKKAIELGFTILKEVKKENCEAFWDY